MTGSTNTRPHEPHPKESKTMDITIVLAALARGLDGLGVDHVEATLAAHPGITFADLGVDSLGVIELATIIEDTFGVNVDEHVNTVESPAELAELVVRVPAGV
jgi:acyl carrier protein